MNINTSEHPRIRPMGPLLAGDQAIVDALQRIPNSESLYQAPKEAVVTSYTGRRETTLGLPKDHWSIASVDTDNEGNPIKAEVTLVEVSPKDINLVLRDGSDETRTEEDRPKAVDRAKLHDRETEQSIKLLAAERLNKAAQKILNIQGLGKTK